MPDPSFTAERLTRLARVQSVAPSPDGTWLAVAVSRLDTDEAEYVSDLWRVSLTDRDEAPVRLTRGSSKDTAPAFRRDGSLGFLSNRNPREEEGEEHDRDRNQVWLLPKAGGEPFPLTDEPLGVTAFLFAPEGDRLVVLAKVLVGVPHEEQRARRAELQKRGPSALSFRRMPVRYWDHWIEPPAPHLVAYDAHGQGRRDLTPEADREHREASWDLSRDGARVVITRAEPGPDRIEDTSLLVLATDGSSTTTLGTSPRTRFEQPHFSPDGLRIACVREERFEDRCPTESLWLFDTEGGAGRVLAPDWDLWPTPACFTPDGAAVLATAAARGEVPVFRVDVATSEVTRITAPDAGGSHEGVRPTPSGDAIVGIRHRLHHPPEPFRVALRAGAEPEFCASLSGFDADEGARTATVERLVVEGADGVPVETLLLLPVQAPDAAPPPLLLWIHGGPISAWADGWHFRWNPLVAVAHGYAVALPNPRGSTGYGQRFIDGIWGNTWGAACYDDLCRVTDALEARADVDGRRMAAMGGSFGGYMTNWIGGRTDRFRCLITHASLYDLSAFYGVTDNPAWFALELAGTPYGDTDAFELYSPHKNVGQWKSPTLVIHGERDYRVPIGEALALFEALQLHGVDSELLIFPDENHWILKPRNARLWYERALDFLDRHMDHASAEAR